ncbi:MAG TPA: alpha/beta fold hydrolase [Caldimonas sp.]|jgi:dipeptidyl aminopeptidase/acylaminoacyl peptidase|nr:alpha/beta fold hydrolase [Caldimonas sp.]HEX4235948.1 alpha/beta fold hydrolase [Caldimonas sp.]
MLLTAAATIALSAHADNPVPVAAFFSQPEIGEVRLSPSGKYLALTVPTKEGRLALAVVDTELSKPPVVVASDRRIDIRWFEWVNDDWLVYDLIDLQRGGGDQNFGAGLFSVRRDGSGARVLIHSGADTTQMTALSWTHGLLSVPRNGGTEVIVGEYHRDNLREVINVTPKRVDVTNGRVTSAVLGYPNFTTGWVFDRDGDARVAVAQHDGVTEFFWHPKGQGDWRSLMRARYLEVPWGPVAVDVADTLYVTRRSADSTSVLTRFDFKTGAPEAEPIASAPGFDFRGEPLMWSGKVVGVRLWTDAETSIWFDPHRKALQELADKRFPGRVNQIDCGECVGDAVVLVHSYSDRAPGDFWIYREKTGEWATVGSVRSAIDPRRMGTLDLHRIKARDGEDLPVWVTMPQQKATGPLPAVVLVHGGPWLRGTDWQWDANAQFLASRGYVVIQPEFRGSRGFGFDHFRKGWKNWGTTMQDDVADAARWAASKGIVDPKRICIAGGSYGGYATLMGAIRYPDLYRCGIAYVAVTDPRLMFANSWQNDSNREMREFSTPLLVGDPVKDAELLKAAAPVERAGEIRIPILMAFGRDDRRVPIEHGTQMRAAMRATGHEPEWIVYEGEGHGWLKTENQVDFWDRVETFLAKQLH